LEALEDRTLLSVTLGTSYTGLSSAGFGGGFNPPDTNGAAGPTNYVETVNQGVGIYSPKTSGAAPVTDTLAHFYFTTGGLTPAAPPATDEQSDCFVIFDPLVQRFIVGDLDFDTTATNGVTNNLLLAVSKSASPATLTKADWFFNEIPTTEATVNLQDYPGNPGYNADALVVTLLSFPASGPPVHSQINAISMKALVSGTPLVANTNYFQTDNGDTFNLRPTAMQDATAGGPMWMLAENGSNSSIDVIKMTNVLSAAPVFTTTSVPVNPYFTAVPELQPGGTSITTATDSRIMNASEQNGQIVAAHIVSNAAGNLDNARWYEFNVSSGSPVLQQEGDISGGPGVYDAYPGIAINPQGAIGMSYVQSGIAPGQFMSTYITGRTAVDAPGTMETPVLVQAGAGVYNGNREGDLSGINVDSDGSFWIANEIANTDPAPNWGTVVAHFSVGAPFQIQPFSATEGQVLTLVPVASFIDSSGTGAGSYSATIDWGDGISSPGTVTGSKGLFFVKGTHTYTEEGTYSLSVHLHKGNTDLGTASGDIVVADAPLIGRAVPSLNSTTGGFLSNVLVAGFTDTDATNTSGDPQGAPGDYVATVTFLQANGLSTTSIGRIVPNGGNSFLVFASNPFSFASGGTFQVRTIIRDVGGATVEVDTSVNVTGKTAIPPLLPMYGADSNFINAPFVVMENALTNLLISENLFLASMFSTPAVQMSALANFMFADFEYEIAVFHFDLTLPF
jgi:hypothetical protein